MRELPINFDCQGDRLDGMLHLPNQPFKRGLLIIVGGPQYRVGSHRQFTLLARYLATEGIAVMRFDYRGMGDSEGNMGKPEPCEHVEEDIRVAIDAFLAHVPDLEELALWGLCDGASAAMLYASTDPRITGIVALNPWVSTKAGAAKTYLKHYYVQRLFNINLWRKILRFEFDFTASLKSFLHTLAALFNTNQNQSELSSLSDIEPLKPDNANCTPPIHERTAHGLNRFDGRVLFIISGNDLIAAEFMNLVSSDKKWQKLMRSPHITLREFQDADHTFSCREWRDQVAVWTRDWIQSW